MNELKNDSQLHSGFKEISRKFQCSQCYQCFRFRRHYDKHLEGHKQNNCKFCGKLFTVRKHLAIHLHDEHNIKLKDFKYNCQYCDKNFVKKLSLYQHYRVHGEGKKVCLDCGGFFSETTEFLKHQEKHKYAKPWKCGRCDAKFTRRQQYEVHIQGHEKYKCLTCTKSFSAQSKLAQHKKKGHKIKEVGAKHVCEICERQFSLQRALVLHQRVHQGNKSFDNTKFSKNLGTQICNSKLPCKAALRRNKSKAKDKQNLDGVLVRDFCSSIHEEGCDLQLPVVKVPKKEEPTKCTYCDYKSSCKANLKRHMDFHTEDRKFICECCGASFRMLCALKEHYLYVHSEGRNFPCPKCDKSFKRKCGLNRHLRDHSENRPHICYCGQSYKRMSHLKRHKESSHGLVSKPNKLSRLRHNELGVLVPIEEESLPQLKQRIIRSSACQRNEIHGAEHICDGEQRIRHSQDCRYQESRSVSCDTSCTETNINMNKEILDGAVENKVSKRAERIIEMNVNGACVTNGDSDSQVFNLQCTNGTSSKDENSAFSSDPQVHLNVDYIFEGMPNMQANSLQGLGVVLENQIISYPSCSQVVDIVQIVPSCNPLPQETTVLLCLSSVPSAYDGDNSQHSTE